MSGYLDGSPDLADFVRTLSRHGVAYMVVGGHAVGFHSKPRATKDLDVWIDKSPENRKRIAVALAAYGARRQIAEHVLTAAEDEIVWFGRPPNRVDIILTCPGSSLRKRVHELALYRRAAKRFRSIGLPDLIRNKECVGRDQDLVDVKWLKKAETPR